MLALNPTILDGIRLDGRLDKTLFTSYFKSECGNWVPVWSNTEIFRMKLELWFTIHEYNIGKLVDTTLLEYNPIENYNRVEEGTREGHDTRQDTGTESHSGEFSESITGTFTRDEINSGEYSENTKDTSESSETRSYTHEEHNTGNDTGSNSSTVDVTGNYVFDKEVSGSNSRHEGLSSTEDGSSGNTLTNNEKTLSKRVMEEDRLKSAYDSTGYVPYERTEGETDDDVTVTGTHENSATTHTSGSSSSDVSGTNSESTAETDTKTEKTVGSGSENKNIKRDTNGSESGSVGVDSTVTGTKDGTNSLKIDRDDSSKEAREGSDSKNVERTGNSVGSNNESYRNTITGNIGVTTSQQMIEAERRVVLFNIYDWIVDQLKTELFLNVWWDWQ